jgi:hypothetical protein
MPFYAVYHHFSALKVGHEGSSAMQGSWAAFSSETLALKSANLRRVLPFFQH